MCEQEITHFIFGKIKIEINLLEGLKLIFTYLDYGKHFYKKNVISAHIKNVKKIVISI